MNTERPDIVAANLMEGKVAILIGGTPYVLLARSDDSEMVFPLFWQTIF